MNSHEFVTATPESQGVPSSAILSFIEEVERERIAIDSLIIMRHGKIIAEGYWAPFEKGAPHRLFSAGKAIVAVAILFAVQEGHLSLHDRIVDLLAKDVPEGLDEKWNTMTLYHLLTMHTGHAEDTMRKMFEAGEFRTRAFFDQELSYEPGTHFLYNNGVPDMLGIILYQVTGQRVYEYLKPRLFEPLQMNSMYVAANGHLDELPTMTASTRSLLKLTLLFYQHGEWEGKQILDRKLADMAVSYLVPSLQDPEPPMVAADTKFGYGFQIWRNSVGGFRIDGGQGQFGIGLPDMDLLVVMNASEQDQGILPSMVWKHITNKLFAEEIVENPAQYEALKNKLSVLTWAQSSSVIPEKNDSGSYELQEELFGFNTVALSIENNKLSVILSGSRQAEINAGTLGDGIWVPCKTVIKSSSNGFESRLNFNQVTGEDSEKSLVCAYYSDRRTLTVLFRSKGMIGEHRLTLAFSEEGDSLTYESGKDYDRKVRSEDNLHPALRKQNFDQVRVIALSKTDAVKP